MKKKLFSALLAVVLALTLLPATALAWHADNDWVYEVNGGNLYFNPSTGAITGADDEVTMVQIPSQIDGIPVTMIDEYAFQNCTNLISVTIPDTVTCICNSAFYSSENLKSVTIPASVTRIEELAFSYSYDLTDVYYGGSEKQWNAIDLMVMDHSVVEYVPYGTLADVGLGQVTIHYAGGSSDTQPPAPGFTDVKPGIWYEEAVQYAVEYGLMNGVSSTRFDPTGKTTRGTLMTILARLDGVDTQGSSPWYQTGMEWAVGVGVSDGKNPKANITRQDLATMLWRFAYEPEATADLSGFPDNGQVSGYAVQALAWAVEQGIMKGGTDGNLSPKNTASRAEVATMLMRYCETVYQ